MNNVLLVDFGSTYTKVMAVDMETETVLGRSQAPTTIDTDIMIGLRNALENLRNEWGVEESSFSQRYACSSAAGGLKMAAIGLVPALTLEAARRAALGAGAKVVCSYGYEIDEDIVEEIIEQRCDIVMLAGGTDGGNKSVIIHNAEMLARSEINCPILVCGNTGARRAIRRIFDEAGKKYHITENVLPTLDSVNPAPAQEEIRDIFIEHIVKAKGLENAQEYMGKSIIPTPMASLRAAELLSGGTRNESGIGDLLVVEIGGATTNIHSIASNQPVDNQTILRGLPESRVKRTVEGDLGIRWNSHTICELNGEEKLREILKGLGTVDTDTADDVNFKEYTDFLYHNVEHTPENDLEYELDITLAKASTNTAVSRHVGTIHKEFTVSGEITIQQGKNMLGAKSVIGTGGIFKYGKEPERILEAALFDPQDPWSLKPRKPQLYVDKSYILYGVGLLADEHPDTAIRIAKKYLVKTDR